MQFQFGEGIGGAANRFGALADPAGHLEQNAMRLRLLFIEQTYQIVILLDRLNRLNKDSLPARTRPVHNPRHAPLLFDLHRNHKTFATNGDEFVLHRSAFR